MTKFESWEQSIRLKRMSDIEWGDGHVVSMPGAI